MIKIECSCGQRGYVDYIGEHNGVIGLSLDIDTMKLEYNDDGMQITCPNCKSIYQIIRVQ